MCSHPSAGRPQASGEQGYHPHPSLLFPLACRLDPEENIVVQPGPSSEAEAEQDTETKGEAEGEAVLMEEDLIQQSLDDYDAGKYSPRLLGPNELPFDAHVLEAEEDTHRLLLLRQQLQVTGRSPPGSSVPAGPAACLARGACVCVGVQGGRGTLPSGAGSGAHIQSWPGRGMSPGSEGCCGPDKSSEMGLRPLAFLWGPRIRSFPAPSPTTKLFMGFFPLTMGRVFWMRFPA